MNQADALNRSKPGLFCVGVIGIGRMGSAVLRRLAEGPWRLSAHDRDIRRAEDARDIEAVWFDDVRDLAAGADVVLTILPNGDVVRDLLTERTFTAFQPGTVWIDATSSDPAITTKLTARARAHHVDVVAAPIGGSPTDAAAGRLQLFTAGDPATIERVRPLLTFLTAPGGIRTVGTTPAHAHTVKLLINALWCAHALATSEALLIAQRAGIPPTTMQALLHDTAGASSFSDQHLPQYLDGNTFNTFGIDGLVIELHTVRQLAQGLRTPLLDASMQQHEAALEHFGPALGELLAVKLLEEQNRQTLHD